MFTLFALNQSSFSKEVIRPFLKVFKDNPALSPYFEGENGLSVISLQQQDQQVYGGAILIKRKVAELPPKTRKAMTRFASESGEVWTCTVCLHLQNDSSFPDFEPQCRVFYQKLYESLVDFGQKNKANFLCMMLVPGEYLSTEVIGLWPYVVEVRPQESRDGLFHGVLSLISDEPSSPTNVWQTLVPEISKLAA